MKMASGPLRVDSSANIINRSVDITHIAKEHVKHTFQLAPHILSMVIVAAHASHITEVFKHISGKQMVLASAMFAIWYFTKSGSEEL